MLISISEDSRLGDTVHGPRPNRHILRDFLLVDAILQLLNNHLWIEVHANRVLREKRAAHERVRLLVVVKEVDLRLEDVAVWVGVVQGEGDPVVDAPEGGDPVLEALSVGKEELWDGVEREGDVLQGG